MRYVLGANDESRMQKNDEQRSEFLYFTLHNRWANNNVCRMIRLRYYLRKIIFVKRIDKKKDFL